MKVEGHKTLLHFELCIACNSNFSAKTISPEACLGPCHVKTSNDGAFL